MAHNPSSPSHHAHLDNLPCHVPLLWLCQVEPEVQPVRRAQAGPHVVAAQRCHQPQLLAAAQGLKHLQQCDSKALQAGGCLSCSAWSKGCRQTGLLAWLRW